MPTILRPQKGPQEKFLSSAADIVIFGGSAGGGKSFGLLLTPLRYINVKGFGGTIFRKNANQIFKEGGLWDEAWNIYGRIKGTVAKKLDAAWVFNNAKGEKMARISFAHIERDEDVHSWQGTAHAFIGFDELTHFSKFTFFYMLSRNRSTCGVKPFVRATCNPDSDSWVADFISWWIDQDTGYAIPERSGKIRYFIRRGEDITWADTKKELWEKFDLKTDEEKEEPKSVTFISSSIYDNQELLKINPQYLANLKALPEVERERLLFGNWKIKPSAGMYFKRTQVEMTDNPGDIQKVCRAWDLAATDDSSGRDADYTSGVLIGLRKDGTFVVLDVINTRIKAGDVEKLIKNTSASDKAKWGGYRYKIRIPIDPGAAGKILANQYVKMLAGYSVRSMAVTGSKESRATPFASQWQNGNVRVMIAPWNETYFSQLESFPESKHDDMVDASSDAFNELTESSFDIRALV